MAVYMGAGMLAAFAGSFLAGKYMIPWWKKNGFVQPLKHEVETAVYNGQEE